MIQKVFAVITGLIWASIMSLPVLFQFVLRPSKMLYKNKKAPLPAELNDVKYGDHKFMNIGPIKLHYVISGPENAPLMLFLHGFPEIWYSWRHQIVEFQKLFRVVAVDMRGFGESDKPAGVENYKLDLLIKDVMLLIEALDYKSCVLIAHDWGGGVAWAFANQHPQMVDKLIVLNMCPVPLWRSEFMSNIRQFVHSGYIFFFFLPYLAETICGLDDCNMFTKIFMGKGSGDNAMTSADVDCYKYYFRQPGAFTPGINYYRANLWPPGYQHALKYPMPVKVIWGCRDDYLTLALLDALVKAVTHVDVTRLEEASHWVQCDQPDKVNKAIRDFI